MTSPLPALLVTAVLLVSTGCMTRTYVQRDPSAPPVVLPTPRARPAPVSLSALEMVRGSPPASGSGGAYVAVRDVLVDHEIFSDFDQRHGAQVDRFALEVATDQGWIAAGISRVLVPFRSFEVLYACRGSFTPRSGAGAEATGPDYRLILRHALRAAPESAVRTDSSDGVPRIAADCAVDLIAALQAEGLLR